MSRQTSVGSGGQRQKIRTCAQRLTPSAGGSFLGLQTSVWVRVYTICICKYVYIYIFTHISCGGRVACSEKLSCLCVSSLHYPLLGLGLLIARYHFAISTDSKRLHLTQ